MLHGAEGAESCFAAGQRPAPRRLLGRAPVLPFVARLIVGRLGLLLASGDRRDAEILALRYQILVLQREVPRRRGGYVGDLFASACRKLGVTQSMGRVGSALDNAAAESFNSTLEHELLSRQRFTTKNDARRAVARFIDADNHRRRHSSCEMLPPVVYEALLTERAATDEPERAA